MELRSRKIGDVLAVEVRGSAIDAECAEDFRAHLEPHLLQHKKIVLDLRHVAFADSTGLGAILGCLHRAAAVGGELRVAGLRPLVQEMFRVLGLSRLVDIHATSDDAVAAFAPAVV